MNAADIDKNNEALNIIFAFNKASNTSLIFMSLIGSRCRGTEHAESDYDYFFMYEPNDDSLDEYNHNVRFKQGDMEFTGMSMLAFFRKIRDGQHQFLEALFAKPLAYSEAFRPDYLANVFTADNLVTLTAGFVDRVTGMLASAETNLKRIEQSTIADDVGHNVEGQLRERAKESVRYSAVVLNSALLISEYLHTRRPNELLESVFGVPPVAHELHRSISVILNNFDDISSGQIQTLINEIRNHPDLCVLVGMRDADYKEKQTSMSYLTAQFSYETYLTNRDAFHNLVTEENPLDQRLGSLRRCILRDLDIHGDAMTFVPGCWTVSGKW